MADTVVDVPEKVLGTPEKEAAEKKVVEEVEDVDDDSVGALAGDNDSDVDSEEVKENGTSTEENGSGDAKATDAKVSPTKNGESNGVSKDEVVASKRKSVGGDATDGKPTEGASPEKKAKLDSEAVEVEANGDAEVVA